ncbi:hypothetical protein BDY21DRAFT_110332 [Lineolata rhizophorae]|uniref:Uncharacterized protein n=1 Tax=Lineolata rhizophorae TaxID=578093 RepID=A0A6A6NQN8_9PEZI|nr:hypothetical protein BDY21DRAFT_110332 [Lineolata rhizophorae]
MDLEVPARSAGISHHQVAVGHEASSARCCWADFASIALETASLVRYIRRFMRRMYSRTAPDIGRARDEFRQPRSRPIAVVDKRGALLVAWDHVLLKIQLQSSAAITEPSAVCPARSSLDAVVAAFRLSPKTCRLQNDDRDRKIATGISLVEGVGGVQGEAIPWALLDPFSSRAGHCNVLSECCPCKSS